MPSNDRKDVEPLALLVHPQQPLSYLERLIQSELPPLKVGKVEKIPSVHFRAEDSGEEHLDPDKLSSQESMDDLPEDVKEKIKDGDRTLVDGKVEYTGKISGGKKEDEAEKAKRMPDTERPNFVRWSPSTEIGDFIRDASRGQEFSVEIEGAPEPIYIAVPSFSDRTYYLRMRLRKTSRRIAQMADIKNECDHLAHKGAQRVAQGGFAVLVGWWYIVYRLTFETDLGWDTMEPITYLVGLSGLIGGYMWFLYHNREVSYRSAMNITVSRRQNKLYEQRGLDLPLWESLVEEANRLRREIKLVAEEYDVDWDEKKEVGDEKVKEVLRKERKRKSKSKENSKKDDDDDDEDE